MRSRITFETDTMNDYFSRSIDPGRFELWLQVADQCQRVQNYVGPNLQNGVATLSIQLPSDCKVNDELQFVASVIDPTLETPFENRFTVRVKPPSTPSSTSSGRRKPPSKESGDDRTATSGISLPKIMEVHEAQWPAQSPVFNKYTALRIKDAGTQESDEAKTVYDFFINMDNFYLKSEIKVAKGEADLVRKRFIYGNVLIGLAMLHQAELDKKLRQDRAEANEEEDETSAEPNIEDRVASVTSAIAPVLLPMIESLGAIDLEEIATADAVGDAT
jgi:hypothetical protein